jgi:hypothetical protein
VQTFGREDCYVNICVRMEERTLDYLKRLLKERPGWSLPCRLSKFGDMIVRVIWNCFLYW